LLRTAIDRRKELAGLALLLILHDKNHVGNGGTFSHAFQNVFAVAALVKASPANKKRQR
jgi:hypothetical protein